MVGDSELFGRVVQRDREAFAEFYDRWADVLFPVCVRILRDATEAEDVLQDIFVQVWREAGRYDPARAPLKSWLFSIARSRSLDRWRSRKAAGARIVAAEPLPEPGDSGAAAESSLLRQDVIRTLGRLSVKERTVLVLAYFEGLTQTEIAAHLGEPLGTVKSRARAGLAKLQSLFSGERTDV
ncbi:MAG TPA: sigma-70 family RNA polymerase sigma factor [Thermoanaerobaculia bacterium]|nr:sigma-70 family RNA polymerase sigma factor [Thermoanaerobaculia bacterium]